ncbi:DUF3298 domain-containing protein [Clostridia bacterium]|nr:DUF3298 domain-containing protein [Clostridia bacterium]
MKEKNKRIYQWSAGLVALFAFVITINVNPVLAESLSRVPLLGYVVRVSTFTQYQQTDAQYDMNIEIPAIEIDDSVYGDLSDIIEQDGSPENEKLNQVIYGLNEKYSEEGKALYEAFQEETAELDLAGGGHLGVDSGYEVKTNDERFLSLGRYTVNTVASSSTTMSYDTIDKVNAQIVTLPALFKDDTYIPLISELIIDQMTERMNTDDSLVYWLADDQIASFESISADQNFYINESHQLVISFDKYEIAPGYMGLQEFVLDTDDIRSLLIDPNYLD